MKSFRRSRRAAGDLPRCAAFDCALKLLALRDRTSREIRERLERKKYSGDEIAAALAKLGEYGYVNDEKFARAYAVSRTSTGRSWALVRAELLKKGIPRETLSALTDEIKPSEERELKSALELVRRKILPTGRGKKAADKAAGLLSRRGYSWEIIRRALRKTGLSGAAEAAEE